MLFFGAAGLSMIVPTNALGREYDDAIIHFSRSLNVLVMLKVVFPFEI